VRSGSPEVSVQGKGAIQEYLCGEMYNKKNHILYFWEILIFQASFGTVAMAVLRQRPLMEIQVSLI